MTIVDRAAHLIAQLRLQPHPEGRHLREVFRTAASVPAWRLTAAAQLARMVAGVIKIRGVSATISSKEPIDYVTLRSKRREPWRRAARP